MVSSASFRSVDKWRLKIYRGINMYFVVPKAKELYQWDGNQKYHNIEYEVGDTDPKVLGQDMTTVLPEHYWGTP